MSTSQPEPTEEELRAAYEAELAKIRVEHVVLEQVVTLVNLGMRRTGLAPGTEGERDPGQVGLAIDTIRALMPVLERIAPEQVAPIRQALSQLQLAFVRIGGQASAPGEPAAPAPHAPDAPAPAPDAPAPDAPASGAGAPGAGAAGPSGPAPTPPAGGTDGAGGTGAAPQPEEPGPAQRSGRLWIPGQ